MKPDTTTHQRKTALEFLRFLAAGLVNTLVGYCAYAVFIWLGMNMYAAQAAGHVVGTAFNYFNHSWFVFRMRPVLAKYLLGSAVNYVAGLGFLALIAQLVASPYLAGLIATGCTAVFSYVSLKLLAFRKAPGAQ